MPFYSCIQVTLASFLRQALPLTVSGRVTQVAQDQTDLSISQYLLRTLFGLPSYPSHFHMLHQVKCFMSLAARLTIISKILSKGAKLGVSARLFPAVCLRT